MGLSETCMHRTIYCLIIMFVYLVPTWPSTGGISHVQTHPYIIQLWYFHVFSIFNSHDILLAIHLKLCSLNS